MLRLSLVLAVLLGALVDGCGTGYHRVDGRWAWVADAAPLSRQAFPLDADDATFEVLDGGRFARDARSVYFEADRVDGADPATFEPLTPPYARDGRRVYYGAHVVRGADPASFAVLGFPYGRDARDVYYGTVPMHVPTPAAFEVVEPAGGVTVGRVRDLAAVRDAATAALADTLLARGLDPEAVVVVGSAVGAGAGAGRLGDVRYAGALPVR